MWWDFLIFVAILIAGFWTLNELVGGHADKKFEEEMRKNYKLERLQNGETFVTSEKGNSMVPLIKSGQEHKLEPAKWEDVEVGDIVYCKVKSSFFTHLVKSKDQTKGVQIGNNKGHINGWTKQVYGVVTHVFENDEMKEIRKK